MEPKGSLSHSQKPAIDHTLNHKDAVHIFTMKAIGSTLKYPTICLQFFTNRLSPYPFLAFNFCRHLLIKPDFRCLLSMPVNNITHAHHFPRLTVNTTLHSRISRTLKSSLKYCFKLFTSYILYCYILSN